MKRLFLLELGLVWAVAACGGTDQSTLLADGGNSSGNDGGNGADVTVPQKDSGPAQDVNAPSDVSVVDVVTVDAPVGPPDSKIQCGNSTCDAKTQVCCGHYATQWTFGCVATLGDCSNTGDVPITCSTDDNCVSQGQPGYVCCATVGGQGSGTCGNSTLASVVQCQATCTQQNEVPVGCDPQLQNCVDPQAQCIKSQCTLAGFNICI